MLADGCFGIDIADDQWFVVAQRQNGKNLFQCQHFENTTAGLMSLINVIRSGAKKPKICIKSTGRIALNVALRLSSIPEAEVVMLSNTGLQHFGAKVSNVGQKVAAEILAKVAERLI